MRTALPDVNVLLALHWEAHAFHAAAQGWFGGHVPAAWATCPFTQLGFARISSSPAHAPGHVSVSNALRWLNALSAHPSHVFWSAHLDVTDCATDLGRVVGHQQLTDAYLLALARAHGGCLVTFDRGLRALAEPGDEPGTLLILEP